MGDKVTNEGDKLTEGTINGQRLVMSYIPIDDLVPYQRNTRKHSPTQITALRKSIRTLGFGTALAVWKDNMILAGHGRVSAARMEGLQELPCLDLSHLSFLQARAFAISDNKVSDLADWDKDNLGKELVELNDFAQSDAVFDLDALGFSDQELAKFAPDLTPSTVIKDTDHQAKAPVTKDNTAVHNQEKPTQDNSATSPKTPTPISQSPDAPAICQPGNVWHLGDHQLICGQSAAQCDIILQQYHQATGAEPIRDDGQTLSEVATVAQDKGLAA